MLERDLQELQAAPPESLSTIYHGHRSYYHLTCLGFTFVYCSNIDRGRKQLLHINYSVFLIWVHEPVLGTGCLNLFSHFNVKLLTVWPQ